MKFTVQPTPDFKPQAQQEADCSVLLKLKKGDEYKLVLNMQNYNPENITVKLNGQELTVLATAAPGSTDDFKQTHVVPEGIDLDQMSSSKMLDARLPELQSKPSVLQVFVLNKFSLMREDHFKNFTVSASGQPSK